MARSYKSNAKPRSKQIIAVALVAVGALLTAVLVVLALTAHRGGDSEVAPRPVGVEGSEAPRASPDPTPTLESTTAPAPAAAGPRRFLSAVDGSTAWRGFEGSCPGASTVESSGDGGATWQAFDASAGTGAASLLRLEASNADLVYLVALDQAAGCAPVYVATYSNGAEFTAYPDRTNTVWFRAPGDVRSVRTPGGPVGLPCDRMALAPRSDNEAAVLCEGGDVIRTGDQGASWDAAVAIPGAAAIEDTADGYVVAAVGQDGCDGVQLLALPAAGAGATPLGCAPSDAVGGDVAVSAAGGTVWLWAGDAVLTSADGGATW